MSSIDKKKSSIQQKQEEQESYKPPNIMAQVTVFGAQLLNIAIILLISYAISPPLFYAIQFVNDKVMNETYKYKNKYETFDEFLDDPANVDKKVPKKHKKTVQILKEAFNIALAQGFFTSRGTIKKILGVMHEFMGFPYELNIYSDVNTQIKEMRDSKGNLIGLVAILFAPMIYGLLLGAPILTSSVMMLFAFMESLNIRTMLKLAVMYFICWLMWFLVLPLVLAHASIIVLISVLLLAGLYYGTRMWISVVTSIGWMSKWMNDLIMKKTGKRGTIPEGPIIEWKTFAQDYRLLYVYSFAVMGGYSLITSFGPWAAVVMAVIAAVEYIRRKKNANASTSSSTTK